MPSAEQGLERSVNMLADFANLQTMQAYCPSQPSGRICQLVISEMAVDTPMVHQGATSVSVSAVCQQVLGLRCTLTLTLPSDGRFRIQLQPQNATILACEPAAVSAEVSVQIYWASKQTELPWRRPYDPNRTQERLKHASTHTPQPCVPLEGDADMRL